MLSISRKWRRMVAGEAYRRPAGVEHDVMNAAEVAMAFIEVEMKKAVIF